MTSAAKKIRVLIADDHRMLRDSLQDLLDDQKGIEVVGGVESGEECVRTAKQLKPDVILMDIKMGGLSGLDATRLIKAESPRTKVIIISTYEDEMHVLGAFQAGADGYVPKTFPAAKIIDSIRRIQKEGALVPDAILPKLLRGVRSMGAGAPSNGGASDLSAAELKVLDLVKKGLQNKEIARDLGLSEKTVRNHLNNTFLKLGVNSRTAAIVKAIQKGILALEE